MTAGIYDEIVPGTGVTASLLSWLIFNRYQMATPAYRESKGRLKDMNWDTCRQNLINWADKGAIQLNKLIPALKEVALQEGANVNVDETWCRYQAHFGHRKTYMWCLVNRALGIVIFFYEDTTDEKGVKHEGENQVSDLMWRALNYLHDFWDNLFAYRKDGEYAISNCAAEQAIRPQTVQRKNSLFYCSTKGAVNSAIYNTFIETCKQAGISFREYFRRVILELKHGRTDYARSNLFACYQRDARTCFR